MLSQRQVTDVDKDLLKRFYLIYNSKDIAIVRCNSIERISEIDVYLRKLKQEKLMCIQGVTDKQRLISVYLIA